VLKREQHVYCAVCRTLRVPSSPPPPPTHPDAITERLRSDKYLAQHAQYFCKEMRAIAYRQYIQPYRSVTFPEMAAQFGVQQDFLEKSVPPDGSHHQCHLSLTGERNHGVSPCSAATSWFG